jgi:hypothetical protein
MKKRKRRERVEEHGARRRKKRTTPHQGKQEKRATTHTFFCHELTMILQSDDPLLGRVERVGGEIPLFVLRKLNELAFLLEEGRGKG